MTRSGVRYTRELLTVAAAQCADIDAVIAFCGAHPYHQLRRHLFKRFEHFGIDVSHFVRRGPHGSKPRPSADELRHTICRSTSIAETLRRLGRPDNTHTRNLFHEWVAEDGLSTEHFLGQAHQRGKPGTGRKAPHQVLVKHSRKNRTKSALLRRALCEIGVSEECANCGIGPVWHGRPLALEVDHVNGDWSDDRAKNLRILCPNCHALTSTWCRGGRRRHRTVPPV
ncbi:HNH endonuclease [Streptomyces blastmyceticus]|uniref:Endonuclease n=1 Tax=Streptomyces blastmyceticus TaxID=68180 RepID=A0ABN0WAI1_9ACTN